VSNCQHCGRAKARCRRNNWLPSYRPTLPYVTYSALSEEKVCLIEPLSLQLGTLAIDNNWVWVGGPDPPPETASILYDFQLVRLYWSMAIKCLHLRRWLGRISVVEWTDDVIELGLRRNALYCRGIALWNGLTLGDVVVCHSNAIVEIETKIFSV
jgi:hypothetical protein